MNQETNDPKSKHKDRKGRRFGRRARLGIAAAALIGVGMIVGATVSIGVQASPHGGFGAWGHHQGGHSLEQVQEKAAHRAAWLLDYVDATEAQEAQVKGIVDDLVISVYPMFEQHRANHDALTAQLTQPVIERQAIEVLRLDEMMLADRATAELADTLSEIAQVLSLEQRQKLTGMAKHFRH